MNIPKNLSFVSLYLNGPLGEPRRRLGRRLITTCGGDVEVGRKGQLQHKETKTI